MERREAEAAEAWTRTLLQLERVRIASMLSGAAAGLALLVAIIALLLLAARG